MSDGDLEGRVQDDHVLDESVESNLKRYNTEPNFRKIVHAYLKLPPFSLWGLSMSKTFSPKGYEKKKEKLLRRYCETYMQDTETAAEIDALNAEKAQVEEEAARQAKALKEAEEQRRVLADQGANIGNEKARLAGEVAQKFEERKAAVVCQAQEERQRIIESLDASKIVRAQLQGHISKLQYVTVDDQGELKFDESQMVNALEDILLKEIVAGIEASDGRGGFMAKLKETYEGVVKNHEQIESLSQLKDVDWVKSAILSRMKGYPVPTYPYLLVGKRDGYSKVTVPTAVCLDISGSMTQNQRMLIARKTCLALTACMRKADPQNETTLAVYNTELKDVTALELWKEIEPAGYTATHLALQWLVNKLDGRGPSIAYLITDGRPQTDKPDPEKGDAVQQAILAAREFRSHPEIMLRIFLVDGDAEAEKTIRKIGYEAGQNTKVIPVKNYQLAGGTIRNVKDTLRDMISIGSF